MFNSSKLGIFILLSFCIHLIFNISNSKNEINHFIFPEDINYQEYQKICIENLLYNHEKCFSFSKKYEEKITKELLLTDLTKIKELDKEKVSYIYYNLGNIYYHGHVAKEPQLDKGLAYFIISSFFGSPQSKYKLSIILSNGIFEQIYKGKNYQKLLSNLEMLKKISETEFYKKNFIFLMNEYYNCYFTKLSTC